MDNIVMEHYQYVIQALPYYYMNIFNSYQTLHSLPSLMQNQQPLQQANPSVINTRHHLGLPQKQLLSNPDAAEVWTHL